MTILYDTTCKKEPPTGVFTQYEQERDICMKYFERWSESEQVNFVEQLLARMCHYQHGHINAYLKPMLQRNFISLLPSEWSSDEAFHYISIIYVYVWYMIHLHTCFHSSTPLSLTLKTFTQCRVKRFAEKGLDHVAESILSYLDAKSLVSAELVCKEWHRVISEGMLWKKLIERKVRTDSVWRGLAERRGWYERVLLTSIYFNII